MLAPRQLPAEFAAWNALWKAPSGPRWRLRFRRGARFDPYFARWLGPFAFQTNGPSRTYEYPWAYFAMPGVRGRAVADVGGALGGLQFALALEGADVVDVDPFVQYGTGSEDAADPAHVHARINRALGTQVRLQRSTLAEARLRPGSLDVIVSISTLEHLDLLEVQRTMVAAADALRPGGLFIGTVDLFLGLQPLGPARRNQWGTNVPIRLLQDWSGLELARGRPEELLGYPEFDPARIVRDLDRYLLGSGHVLSQLFVLRKPESGPDVRPGIVPG